VTHTGSFTFEFGDGRPPESSTYSVSDADLATLNAYLKEALTLKQILPNLDLGSLSIGMSARVGEAVQMRAREPGLLQRAALLHHLRPFVLNDEPYSFFRLRNIVTQSTTGDFAMNWLKRVKHNFSGKSMQSQLVLSDAEGIVNSEATLVRWLNAFEYHKDPEKAAALEARLAPLPIGVTRPLFFMLLAQKAFAVLHLGHVVAKIVGYTAPQPHPDV
jgi:hypothetical protein